jgi:TRAP-type C4-dicarboxylate transport system substrate-binding protein
VLGDEGHAVNEVKRGAIQCYGGSVSALAAAVPEIAGIELPYIFSSEKKADKIIDEVIWNDLDALLWSRGFKLFFFSENGFRSIGSTFEINSVADLKGKKMRSQDAQEHLDLWAAWGASPVPVSVTEVLPALQTGLVDGFDNTALFSFASSWHQGVSHFTVTEHIYQPGIVVLSRKWFETLPTDIQALFTGKLPAPVAGADGKVPKGSPDADGDGFISQLELSKAGRKGVRAIKGQLLDNFETAGIKVKKLGDSEKASFSSAAAIVHAKFAMRASKEGKALLKKITDAL